MKLRTAEDLTPQELEEVEKFASLPITKAVNSLAEHYSEAPRDNDFFEVFGTTRKSYIKVNVSLFENMLKNAIKVYDMMKKESDAKE